MEYAGIEKDDGSLDRDSSRVNFPLFNHDAEKMRRAAIAKKMRGLTRTKIQQSICCDVTTEQTFRALFWNQWCWRVSYILNK